jgi:hypothetical protein
MVVPIVFRTEIFAAARILADYFLLETTIDIAWGDWLAP